MRSLAIALLALLTLSACGGRVHLEDTTGLNFRRVSEAQRKANPRKGVAPFIAQDIKQATINRLRRGGGATVTPMGGAGYTSNAGGTTGSLNSSTTNLGGGEQQEPRLQAK